MKAGADVNRERMRGEEDGYSPLHIAAEKGHLDVVTVLLSHNADSNIKNKDGSTPLHIAAEKGHLDVVTVLLSHNADGTIKDKDGQTALDIMISKHPEDIAQLFVKSTAALVGENLQMDKIYTAAALKLLIAQKRAFIAEKRALTAETRATIAEERAATSEETASVSDKTATSAEERAIMAEKRAVCAEEAKTAADSRASLCEERVISAETRAALAEDRAIAAERKATAAEQRATIAEKECAVVKQRLADTLKQAAVAEESIRTTERRATIAEERASAANKKANTEKKRAKESEARAAAAETRASVAEERAIVVEMEAIAAEKNVIATNAKVMALEERANKAEGTVTMLQKRVHISDNRIAELMQTNTALEQRATGAEQQIQNLTLQCKDLQEQLDKANTPTWVVQKEDIVLTDKELGRGGWGMVKAARFCGLEVAAKFLHGAIVSDHNQQLFKREMNMSALVRHPNIILFIGATMELDQEYIILTELMHTSLRAVLEDKTKNKVTLSRQQVCNIATDVARALNYLHLMKPDAIIHRDVSSSNVLLEPLGGDMWRTKLSDFGSCNFARQVTTVAPGNATYAAPESSDPELQSPKMDVFSYGILLLEMVHGQFPEVQRRQELIRQLSWSNMKTLIENCAARDKNNRPNIADVLIRLPNM